MDIKYNKKKEEIRHDPVMEWLVSAKDFVVKNSGSLVTVIVIAAVIAAGYSAYSYMQKAGMKRANDAFGKAILAYSGNNRAEAVEALSLVADKHRSSPQGAYSSFLLGHMYMDQGDYTEAMVWLDIAAKHPKAGFIAGESLEALAGCQEANGNLEDALRTLEKALENKGISYRYPALRWKAALVSRKLGKTEETRQFCRQILSDTLAVSQRQNAQNLLAELNVM